MANRSGGGKQTPVGDSPAASSSAVASQVLHMTGGEGFHLQFLVREDVGNFLPSGRGKDKNRLPRILRGRSRGKVPTGGGNHAMVTCRRARIPVPECF